MKGIKEAQMGIIAVLALMLVSIKRRLPEARRLSSGITTLALAGIVLLVAAGSVSALPACSAPGNTVITASCELDQDWDVPAGQNGYIIGADNIVIDGNGHYINGSIADGVCFAPNEGDQPAGICNYDAARYYGYSNVTIKNLEVKNFCTGILVRGATATNKVENTTIFRCNIHDNGDPEDAMGTFGIHFFTQVHNSTVDECEVHNNTGGIMSSACDSGGMGIRLKGGCKHNNIIENYVHDNRHAGIYSKGACMFNYVAYNNVTGNGVSATAAPCGGITLRCKKTSNWIIEMNNVTDHFGPGIYVGGDHNKIRYNTVMGCKDVTGGDLPVGHAIQVGRSDGSFGLNELYNNTFCSDNAGVADISICGSGSGINNIGDDNAADTCFGCGANGNNVLYPYTCDDKVSGYFDFDGDGLYSNDPANCACGIVGGGTCACCNPGMFNSSHANMLNSTSPAIVWLTPGEDNQDSMYGLALPDLMITAKHEEWITPGSTYNITYTIENQGGEKAGMSDTGVYINGVYNTSDPVGELNPGQSDTRTIAGPFTLSAAGYDDISLLADSDSAVPESDESNWYNNTLSAVKIYVDPPSLNITPQDQFDINITVDPAGIEVYGVEYYLTYNTSVLRAESQVKGPFLGTTSETIVVVNEIDRGAGIVSYAETRKNSLTGVREENISSVIQFTAIGAADEYTDLDLDGVIIVKVDGYEITAIIEDGEVCLTNNLPPVASGRSRHLHNNAQKKFECLAMLCSNSTDPDGDDPDGGGKIVYIRWAFGDGEYGTSEGLGDCPCKNHSYTSWIWEPFGVSYKDGGRYVAFNASLTVTDNGDPQLEDTTYIDVHVYLAGDANADGTVNILDAVLIGLTWGDPCTGADCCELLWGTNDQADRADLNNDCKINILDAVIVGTMWNHNAYYPV